MTRKEELEVINKIAGSSDITGHILASIGVIAGLLQSLSAALSGRTNLPEGLLESSVGHSKLMINVLAAQVPGSCEKYDQIVAELKNSIDEIDKNYKSNGDVSDEDVMKSLEMLEKNSNKMND